MKKFGTFGRKLKAHKSEVDKLEANPQPPLTPKKSFTSLKRKLKDRYSMADIPDRFIFLPLHVAPGARSLRLLKLLPGDELGRKGLWRRQCGFLERPRLLERYVR